MPLLFGESPHFDMVFELMERTSPIHSRVGSHIFLLSLFLILFDEPVKLFPSLFIKMVFIYLYFYLIPTLCYFCRYCDKPIYKTSMLLFFKLVFFWRIITDMLYASTLNYHSPVPDRSVAQ
jgi:hypothetical protein